MSSVSVMFLLYHLFPLTQDGHLVLADYSFMCVQCRPGYEEGLVEGIDAVLGRVEGKGWSSFSRVKQSPGSGVLSVRVTPDGPTRVLHITDENKKVLVCHC